MVPTLMTLNDLERRNSPYFAFLPNSIDFQADYITLDSYNVRKILSLSSSLPLFAKTIKHYAARSFCDSWASCNERLSLKRKWLVCRCNPVLCTVQPVVTSSNQLVFLSPFDDGRLSSRFPVQYNVSFIMDGVKSVRKTFDVFRLLPNPRLLPFTGDRKNYRGEILSLKVNCVIFLTTR